MTTADVLKAAFPMGNSSETAPSGEDRRVHVIRHGSEPRWIIVGDLRRARRVLSSWNPWNAASRMRWSAVKFAASTGMLPMIPGVENTSFRFETSYWRHSLPEFFEDWHAVIHVGTRSHSRKAIVFVVGHNGAVRCAAKVPLVPGARQAIANEAAMLNRMKGICCVPEIVFQDSDRAIAVQTWLEGEPVSRGFSKAHCDLLSLLVNSGQTARVSDCLPETRAQLDELDFPFDRSLLARALEWLEFDEPLQSFVEHRDFAPWNLKWLPNGSLGLLDWEWAVPNSLPWQDVCRFFYLDDVHFSGSGTVWETMMRNELLSNYRTRFDIPAAALPALTMRYLLRVLAIEWSSGNERLARYAFSQVQRLLAILP